ncbi:unnamed protein product, partial [Rotaria socialis]
LLTQAAAFLQVSVVEYGKQPLNENLRNGEPLAATFLYFG